MLLHEVENARTQILFQLFFLNPKKRLRTGLLGSSCSSVIIARFLCCFSRDDSRSHDPGGGSSGFKKGGRGSVEFLVCFCFCFLFFFFSTFYLLSAGSVQFKIQSPVL